MVPFSVEMTGFKRLAGFLTLFLFAAALGIFFFSGRSDRAATAALMIGLALVPAIAWVYFSVCVTVSADSIVWRRLGRTPVEIAWPEISNVEFRSFSRCLIISAADGRRIRIEEQIDRFREVYDFVAARSSGLITEAKRLAWPIRYSTGAMSRFQSGLLAFFSLLCAAGGVCIAVLDRDAAVAFLAAMLSVLFGFAATRIPMRYELGSDFVVVSFLIGRAVHSVSSLSSMERRVFTANGLAYDLLELRFGRRKILLAGMFTDTPLHVIEERLRLEYAGRLAPAVRDPEPRDA